MEMCLYGEQIWMPNHLKHTPVITHSLASLFPLYAYVFQQELQAHAGMWRPKSPLLGSEYVLGADK